MKKVKYSKVGDYYIPNVKLPESKPIGKYGMMKRDYLKKHDAGVYCSLLATDKLNEYLEDIDKEANAMYDRLIMQYQELYHVNDQLKATNQMKWVQEMNNIKSMVEEVVLNELINN